MKTMKKILLSMLMLLTAGTAMAQMTPEEKAALKAAEKEAKTQVTTGMKLRDEIELLLSANKAEIEKGNKANQAVLDKNNATIKEKASEAVDVLEKALAGGYVAQKQQFPANYALYRVGGILFSPELNKAIAHETMDTLAMAKGLDAYSGGCYGMLQYGNVKNVEQQEPMKEADRVKSTMMEYYSYLAYFYMQNKSLDGSIQAFDKYAGFAKKYPKWAGEKFVKNPKTSPSQLAFNIYYIAFTQKRYDVCDKYYEQALAYDDEESRNFVLSSRPQISLEQGDTVNWLKGMEKIIEVSPEGVNAEIAAQKLLAYYDKKDKKLMSEFADKLLAKNPSSKIANYGKGYSLFAESKFMDAVPYFQKAVEADPDYLEGIYMTGMSLYRQGTENYYNEVDGKKFKTTAEMNAAEEKYVKSIYREAATYFETCREKAEDNPDMWALPLHTIYKNIGEKDKAAELEPYTK